MDRADDVVSVNVKIELLPRFNENKKCGYGHQELLRKRRKGVLGTLPLLILWVPKFLIKNQNHA
jgi:hypothetical protein